MALQFCQGPEDIEALARVAKIFMKMDESDPIPHAVSMHAFGPLRVPRRPLLGCISLQPRQSENGKALLMTLARGSPLENSSFGAEADKSLFKEQMAEFAESMHRKGLVHGGLTSATVYWSPDSQEATVTDFGNAVDGADVHTRTDALHEMVCFLGETFGDAKIRAQTVTAIPSLQAALFNPCKARTIVTGPNPLDDREKLHLLASRDDVRWTDVHGKREF
jgi:hypothetical protein